MVDDMNIPHGTGTLPPPEYDWANDPDGLTPADFDTRDWLLDSLLSAIPGESDTDKAISIGLSVNGTVLSGRAVSFARWTKLWTAYLAESGGRNGQELGEGFQIVLPDAVQHRTDFRSRREARHLPVPSPEYLNLTHVKVIVGGQLVNIRFTRVRISQIDAWWVGEFGEEEA